MSRLALRDDDRSECWGTTSKALICPAGGNIKRTASPRNPTPMRIPTRVVAERSSEATITAVSIQSDLIGTISRSAQVLHGWAGISQLSPVLSSTSPLGVSPVPTDRLATPADDRAEASTDGGLEVPQTGDWIWQRGDGHDALPRIEGLPTASSRAVPLTNLRTISLGSAMMTEHPSTATKRRSALRPVSA